MPGMPSLEEFNAFFVALTGREPTPEDSAATEALYIAEYKKGAPKTKPKSKPKSKRGRPERGP